jgi:DNA-3-methyladenine glycosylase II
MISAEIKSHLQKDKKLKKIIDKIQLTPPVPRPDLYLNLMRAIAGQQLSTKAAATIWGRVLDLFPEKYPDPNAMLAIDIEKLRAAGLSYQKAGYMKNIAQFSIDKTLDYKKLKKKSDDKLIEYLSEIKGVGRWTVEMILMFSLVRENILPLDDLGIQNAIKRLYGLESSGKLLKADMEKVAAKWQPYRTFACMYLWRSLDNEPKKP